MPKLLNSLIINYLKNLSKSKLQIRNAILELKYDEKINKHNIEKLEILLHNIKGTGGTYGFNILSKISKKAGDLFNNIDKNKTEIISLLQELLKECDDILKIVDNIDEVHTELKTLESNNNTLSLSNNSESVFLIITEDNDVINLFTKSLANTIKIISCKNIGESVHFLSIHNIRYILIEDYMLDNQDDISITNYLQIMIEAKNIPIAILKNKISDDHYTKLTINPISYFEKPLNLEFISSKIESLINRFTTTILVIDDDQLIRDLLEHTFNANGFNIICASSGKKALFYLKSHNNVNLIILDQMMPNLNGIETLKAINEIESASNIPVVFLTAKDQDKSIVEKLDNDIDLYLTKPFSPDKILNITIDLLSKAYNKNYLV